MLRKQKMYALRSSPSNSAQHSYQSTCASTPHWSDCGTNTSCPSRPIAAFLARTYWRTEDSATTASGISRHNRIHIRCAVCLCFLCALRSASRIASMNGIAPASFGRSRSGIFRSRGIALARASRTIRRWTPNFLATPLIVPAPCSYSRRICSYNSTLALLFSKPYPPSGLRSPKQDTRLLVYRGAKSEHRSGPIQSIELRCRVRCHEKVVELAVRLEVRLSALKGACAEWPKTDLGLQVGISNL